MRRGTWASLAFLLAACAGARPPVTTPLVDHAPSSHQGLRLLVAPPQVVSADADPHALAASLQSALADTLAGIGYEVVRDPAGPRDFTVQLRAQVASGSPPVRGAVALEVLAGDRSVDELRFENRDASGWYSSDRPFAEHAAVMLVNALERSGRFLDAARGVVAARQSAHRVAVLEFRGDMDPGALATLGDALRTAALGPARREGLTVMTAESVSAALDAMEDPPACLDDGCAVELARRLGAELVVTGDVGRVGDVLVAALRLHDARSGRLVGAANARGATELKLMDSLGPVVRTLFERDP